MNFDMEKAKGRETYNLLIGLVAPRPIALVTSMNEDGRLNAAPFSSYNYLCTDPPIIGMGVTDRPTASFVPKDTARNILRTGEFVVNVVNEELAEAMNICAIDFPAGVNELEVAGLETTPSLVVKVPAGVDHLVPTLFFWKAKGSLYVDDFSLQKVDPATPLSATASP